MSTNDKASPEESFNLKHRVTGAAVLIFFGALVLPWLLGPPSEAQKSASTELNQAQPERPIRSTFEDEVLAQLQRQNGEEPQYEEPEETVYISKISPLNGRSVASDPEPLDASTESKASLDNETSNIDPSREDNADAQTESIASSTESQSSKPELKTANASQKPKAQDSKQVAEQDLAAVSKTKPALIEPKKIEVGWIVQVELLTDKNGAKRLVEKLEQNGFEPKTTIVDTNRGKATGTRIWVGPFENRSSANTENQKLEAKMGKKGFIRVYP